MGMFSAAGFEYSERDPGFEWTSEDGKSVVWCGVVLRLRLFTSARECQTRETTCSPRCQRSESQPSTTSTLHDTIYSLGHSISHEP